MMMQDDPKTAAADTAPLPDTALPEDDIARLRQERDDLRDRYMRALADAENARKRAERARREAEMYGGTNKGNLGGVQAENWGSHFQPFSASFSLPPLSVLVFEPGK